MYPMSDHWWMSELTLYVCEQEPKSKRGRPAGAAGAVGKGRKGAVAKASAKATPAKRKAPTPPGNFVKLATLYWIQI